MKLKRYIALIGICVLLIIGCASSIPTDQLSGFSHTARPHSLDRAIMKPIAKEDQFVHYDQGREILISKKNASSVAVCTLSNAADPRQPLDFHVIIKNRSNASIDFVFDNLEAFCGDSPLPVFRPEQAIKLEEERTDIPSSSLLGIGDITPLAPYMAQYYERRNQDLQDFYSSLLRSQTISAGSMYHGTIRLSFPGVAEKLTIRIVIGEESHEFSFMAGPAH